MRSAPFAAAIATLLLLAASGWYILSGRAPQPAQAAHLPLKRIRAHPLVPTDVPAYGYIYDVKTGRLNEVRRPPKQARPQQGRPNGQLGSPAPLLVGM
jgi:hypothetical protein